MRIKITPAGVVATLALFVLSSGTAVAATGGTFILGRANTASATTSLSNSGGTALSLGGGLGKAALAVNNTAKITRLNSDLLDGLDSANFQRRVSGGCAVGEAIRGIAANGAVTCDNEATSVIEVNKLGTGGDVANCPAGYVVTGGGILSDVSVTPHPVVEVAFPGIDDQTQTEYYLARMINLDGSPYTGQVVVTARCIFGVSQSTSGNALRRAALQREG